MKENKRKRLISLSLKTHTKAKLISVLKNITLNDYLSKAIEEAINKDKEMIRNLIDDDSETDILNSKNKKNKEVNK